MIEPDFGEGQLQQWVNTEITIRVLQTHNQWAAPVIITLSEEFDLGWDTGFYFPWVGLPAPPDQMGCNFFIQYKLSVLLETRGAPQYSYWGEPYFRFQIPHKAKNGSSYVDDFHQWDALKALGRDGYPVFYVTNHVLSRSDLALLAAQIRLLDEIPFLDIRPVVDRHRFGTFTRNSNRFILLSKPEDAPKLTGSTLIGRITEAQRRSLEEDNARVYSVLSELLTHVRGADTVRQVYGRITGEGAIGGYVAAVRRFRVLRAAYQRFFGIHLFRYIEPKKF